MAILPGGKQFDPETRRQAAAGEIAAPGKYIDSYIAAVIVSAHDVRRALMCAMGPEATLGIFGIMRRCWSARSTRSPKTEEEVPMLKADRRYVAKIDGVITTGTEAGPMKVLSKVHDFRTPGNFMLMAYKAVKIGRGRASEYAIMALAIPHRNPATGAPVRTNVNMGDMTKHRADVAYVCAILPVKIGKDHASILDEPVRLGRSIFNARFVYTTETLVVVPDFADSALECGAGIHFFVTPRQAATYSGCNMPVRGEPILFKHAQAALDRLMSETGWQ